jgi:hypothetical protein
MSQKLDADADEHRLDDLDKESGCVDPPPEARYLLGLRKAVCGERQRGLTSSCGAARTDVRFRSR